MFTNLIFYVILIFLARVLCPDHLIFLYFINLIFGEEYKL